MAQGITQFKIFLSSPGDVQEERDIVRELVKEVLPYSPFVRGRATFDVVSWDDPHAAPGLDAHLTPQEAINKKLSKPSECDIVVVILWSRMGTPLPCEIIKRADGSAYQSGTEWEFEDAVNAGQVGSSPATLLYQRTEEPKIGLSDPEFQEKREQYQKVKTFFEQFRNAGGSLTRSFATYETIDAFRELLRQHLDSVVSGFLGQEFSEELGVTKAAVGTMLEILKEQQVPPDQLEAKLKEIADRHLELTQRLHALSRSNDEPEIAKRREQAAEAIENGNYDHADNLLAEAVAIDRRAIDEQQEGLDRRRLSVAASLNQQGELELIRLNYRLAANHFAESASLARTADEDASVDYLINQASALYEQGDVYGDNPALLDAVSIHRSVLETCPRESKPLIWAKSQSGLGAALWRLGQREAGTELLMEAAAAFRSSLGEYTRERWPRDWAANNASLGAVLMALGNRREGEVLLEEAIAAYNAALEEYTYERFPLKWAITQKSRAVAVRTIGHRQRNCALVKESIGVLRAALKELPRRFVPLEWAETQYNLGAALVILSGLEKGTDLTEEAIDHFQLAVEEWTRERTPMAWATVQHWLGGALTALGNRDGEASRLEEAVSIYRAALEERAYDRGPLQWAWTQAALGRTYCALAEKIRDAAVLKKGMAAICKALKVFKEAELASNIAEASQELSRAKRLLADLETKKP